MQGALKIKGEAKIRRKSEHRILSKDVNENYGRVNKFSWRLLRSCKLISPPLLMSKQTKGRNRCYIRLPLLKLTPLEQSGRFFSFVEADEYEGERSKEQKNFLFK